MRNRRITMNRMNRLFTMCARATSPAAAALAVALLIAGGAGTAEAQTQFNWNGSSSTVITNTANWTSGSAPTFGGTLANTRIDVLNGANNTMTYTASQGSTTINSAARGLVIGDSTAGSMLITGGTLQLGTVASANLIGANSVNGTLTIDGGTFLAGTQALQFGSSSTTGTATLTLTSGSANVQSLAFGQTSGSAARAVVNLDGGTFVLGTTGTTGLSGFANAATFNFNGGTLQSSTATTNFLGGFTTANVGTGGARINAANNITITQGLLGGAGDGGLTKSGASVLTLSGSLANTYSGVTTASAGQLLLSKTAGVNAVAGDLAITGGRVSFNANNQIADTSAVTMSGSASVFNGTGYNVGQLSGLNETIASVAVTGGIFLTGGGGAVITVTGAGTFDGSTTYVEYIQNSGGNASFGSLSLIGMTGTTAAGTARTGFAVGGGSPSQLRVGAGGLSLDGSNLLLQASDASANFAKLTLGGDVTTAGSGASRIMTPSGQAGIGRVELSGTSGTVSRTFAAAGGGADLTIAVPITNGHGSATAGIVKAGLGTLTLSATNTYTGTTTVSLGVLRLDSANALPGGIGATGGSSALTINGGVIGLGNGDFSRALGTGTTQVQITGGGGFAAYNADRIVNLGGNATPTSLTWGSGSFITTAGGTFILGATNATNMVTFQNPIDLGSAARTVRIDDGSAAVEATLGGVLSSVSAGNGLTKAGAGTLSLSAANTFNGALAVQNGVVRFSSLAAGTGAQNLGAGALINLGVASTSSGELDYRGSGGTLDKNITALGSGRNRIRNSGAGTLTLSGTLTKNGTIIELVGGTFDVSGRITGASASSDLFVNGAAVTLSNTNNDYNGPTYVYGGGSLTLGANNVIPNSSPLLLGGTGGDTGTGTINTGTFTDTIASLTSSSLGSTVGITINNATAGGLTMGNLTLGGGTDTLALTLQGPTLGRYTLLTYTGVRSGTFDSVTGVGASDYNVLYGSLTSGSIELQKKATIGTITATPASATIIVGGTTAFGFTVQNSAPSLSADLLASVSTGSNVIGSASLSAVAAGETSDSVSGLSFTSNTVGLGQTGQFTLTDAAATNSPQQGSVTVNVLNHSLASFAATDTDVKTLNFGTYDNGVWMGGDGGDGTLGYSIFNIASLGFTDAQTAALDLYNWEFTSGDDIFSLGYSAFQNLASGSSNSFSASVLSPGSLIDGSYTGTYTLKFRDQQNLSGATNTRDLTITLSANVIVVPEPGALALAGIGIAAAAYVYCARRS